MYEKNTIAAPLKMPLTPKGVKGWILAGLAFTKPACESKIEKKPEMQNTQAALILEQLSVTPL
jgi:hypothetical protein